MHVCQLVSSRSEILLTAGMDQLTKPSHLNRRISKSSGRAMHDDHFVMTSCAAAISVHPIMNTLQRSAQVLLAHMKDISDSSKAALLDFGQGMPQSPKILAKFAICKDVMILSLR